MNTDEVKEIVDEAISVLPEIVKLFVEYKKELIKAGFPEEWVLDYLKTIKFQS